MSQDVADPVTHRAWKSTRTMAIICATVSIFTVVEWFLTRGVTNLQWIVASVVTTTCLAFVLLQPRISSSTSAITFLFLVSVMLVANVVTNIDLARRGVRFEAFSAFKLAPIAAAIMAPSPVWVGYLVIGLCFCGPMAVYYGLLDPTLRSEFSIQEPWISTGYAIIALLLLRHRLQAIDQERTLIRLKGERQALDDLARIFLGLRDLTNTPLQSIEFTAHLLEAGKISEQDAARHLRSSLVRLQQFSAILKTHENDVAWSNGELSFDAVPLLHSKVAEMKSGARTSEKTE